MRNNQEMDGFEQTGWRIAPESASKAEIEEIIEALRNVYQLGLQKASTMVFSESVCSEASDLLEDLAERIEKIEPENCDFLW